MKIKGGSGGSGGDTGGQTIYTYKCIFCGFFHNYGELCPELKKLFKKK